MKDGLVTWRLRTWAWCLVFNVCVVSPAMAAPIAGISWDGHPPGTLADLTGETDYEFGHDAFGAGTWEVTWLGGVTAWRDRTIVGANERTLFAPGAVAAGTLLTLEMAAPWAFWAVTPSIAADSRSSQWAFALLSPNLWLWGLEDIALGRCDCDWQDAYGTLRYVPDEPPPTTPVPEPGTLVLLSVGLIAIARRLHR